MATGRPKKMRVTVVKKLDMRDIFGDEDTGCADTMDPICGAFKIGDEFIIDGGGCPPGFCAGAFTDLFKWISGMRAGADYCWMKKPGLMYGACSDGLRPVIFKLERLDEEM